MERKKILSNTTTQSHTVDNKCGNENSINVALDTVATCYQKVNLNITNEAIWIMYLLAFFEIILLKF
jgi:hypothetical protein